MKPCSRLTPTFILVGLLFSVCGRASAQQPKGVPIHDASGCIIFYDQIPEQHRTFKWSGACKNGYGSGPGTLSYYTSNGTLFRTITASENMGLLVGAYTREQFDPPSGGKLAERGNFDAQSDQDGQIDTRYEDPSRVITMQWQYSHGSLVGPHPLVQRVFITPAGVDKFNSYGQTVTYNTFTQGPDGIVHGEGTIVAHKAFKSLDSMTATWVGPIVNGAAGGPGVWTFTGFANMPRMEGIRQQVSSVNANGDPINSVMYGPDGAVWARNVNGSISVNKDVISSYMSPDAGGSNDSASSSLMSLFGIALDVYASKGHNRVTGMPSVGQTVAQSMSSTLKWTSVNQTPAEQKSIEQAQEEARTNVSQDTANRCKVTCSTVFSAQSKRCVMNFGGPGQSIGACSDLVDDQLKTCKEICDDPLRLKTSN
jgi:hypothetical protein